MNIFNNKLITAKKSSYLSFCFLNVSRYEADNKSTNHNTINEMTEVKEKKANGITPDAQIIKEDKCIAKEMEPTLSTTETNMLKSFFIQDNESIIEWEKNHPAEPLFLSSDGQPMMDLHDMSCIKAKPGQGKTHACILLSAVALGAQGFGITRARDDINVVYLDTEMGKAHTAKTIKKVYKNIDKSNAVRFFARSILSNDNGVLMSIEERKEYLSTVIKFFAKKNVPTHLFLDGTHGFIKDPNNLEECKQFFDWMTSLCAEYPIHICNVIHINPSPNPKENKMMGHLGSCSERSVREIYLSSLNGTVFTLSNRGLANGCKYTNGVSLPDITYIEDKNTGIFQPFNAEGVKKEKAAKKEGQKNMKCAEDLKVIFTKIFKESGEERIQAAKLTTMVEEHCGIKARQAKCKINIAAGKDANYQGINILCKHEERKNVFYSLNSACL